MKQQEEDNTAILASVCITAVCRKLGGVGGRRVEGLEPIMMINTLCYSHADSVL